MIPTEKKYIVAIAIANCRTTMSWKRFRRRRSPSTTWSWATTTSQTPNVAGWLYLQIMSPKHHIHHKLIVPSYDQVPWPVMNSLISLDLDHNNFGDNLAEPGRFQGLNVLQVTMTLYLNVCHFHLIYPIKLIHLFDLFTWFTWFTWFTCSPSRFVAMG